MHRNKYLRITLITGGSSGNELAISKVFIEAVYDLSFYLGDRRHAHEFYGIKGGVTVKNINGSFYNFQAEKYNGTNTKILVIHKEQKTGADGLE
mgnify:CR=1 FL=1